MSDKEKQKNNEELWPIYKLNYDGMDDEFSLVKVSFKNSHV